MGNFTLQTPAIPLGATILVTAANSLIGSHVVDQLLAAGYRVRGAVRSPAKCAWMTALYEKRHGPGLFNLFELSDYGQPDACIAAVKGVAGVAHIAGCAGLMFTDLDAEVKKELSMHLAVLTAAKSEPSVKAFALTGSAWSAWTPDASRAEKLTEWTWNERAIEIARSDAPAQEKGIVPFMALKTLVEQACWDWVEREKPIFAFNTLQLDTVLGECLDPKNQGIPSTAGIVKMLWDGSNRLLLGSMQPQWHVDTRDVGRLYVAALVTPGVDRERLFAFGDRYSWFRVAEILKELYPEKELVPIADLGVDRTEVPNARALQLLGAFGQTSWSTLEKSVQNTSASFLSLEE